MVPGFFLLPGFPVRAVGPEGIPGVYNGEHPRRERDLLPFESPWISSAIPSLVVAIGDRKRRPKRRNRGKPLVRIRRVAADNFHLVVRQRSGLMQDRIRDADLADVVQQGPAPNVDEIRLDHIHGTRKFHGHLRDATRMFPGLLIAPDQRLHPTVDRGVDCGVIDQGRNDVGWTSAQTRQASGEVVRWQLPCLLITQAA